MIVDLTIFTDLLESDIYRVAEFQWITKGNTNKLTIKIRKSQLEYLLKKTYPHWYDKRTKDSKFYNKCSINIYNTDYGPVNIKVI